MWKMIAAVGKNLELGKDNDLVFKTKVDSSFFKKVTVPNPVLMGRNTWNSLPTKPLPERQCIVLTSSPNNVKDNDKCMCLKTLEAAGDYVKALYPSKTLYVIGGGQLYKAAIQYCDAIILTEFNAECLADTFFPNLTEEWKPVATTRDFEEDGLSFKMNIYSKKEFMTEEFKDYVRSVQALFPEGEWEDIFS